MESDIQTPPTSDERNFAMLAHLLQLFGGFIAPLVIYLVKRDSRFVAFHALQALIWQGIYLVTSMVFVVGWVAIIIGTIAMHPRPGPSNGPPIALFFLFPLIWLFFIGGWVATLVLSIVYGIKASRGEWARYPIIGRWAQHMVGV